MRLLNDCYLLHYLPLVSPDAFEMQTIQREALKFNTFSFQQNVRTVHHKHTQARRMWLISVWRHIKWECSPTYTGAVASPACPTGQYLPYFFLHKEEMPPHFSGCVTLVRY